MKTFIYTAIVSIFSLTGFAQEHAPIKDVDMLNKYNEVLQKEYPHVFDKLIIKGAYQMDDQHAKIVYSEDGIYNEAIVNSGRKDMLLIATFREISDNNLPKIVTDAFKHSEYSSWTKGKVYEGKSPYNGSFFAIDIIKDKKVKRLFYTTKGEYMKPLY